MNAANALDALEFETAMDLLSDGDNVYAVPVKDGLYYKDQEFPCQLTAHGDGMEFGADADHLHLLRGRFASERLRPRIIRGFKVRQRIPCSEEGRSGIS